MILGIYKPKIRIYKLILFFTANKWEGISASAIVLAWSAEWPPICPKVQAAAAFTKSSGSKKLELNKISKKP